MLNRLIEPLNLVLERPFLVLFRSIFGAGTYTFGAGNLVLENAYLVLDRGLSNLTIPNVDLLIKFWCENDTFFGVKTLFLVLLYCYINFFCIFDKCSK